MKPALGEDVQMRALLISFLVFSAPAFAGNEVKKIDMEDELIEGSVKNPDLIHIMESKGRRFGRLIKLRENFNREMEKSAKSVRAVKD